MLSREVICLNTKKRFSDYEKAARYINLTTYNGILKCCKKIQKYSGKIEGLNASWMYADEYDRLTDKEKEELELKLKEELPPKVVCLNFNKVFNSSHHAAEWVNEENPNIYVSASKINDCCNNKATSAGKINMIRLRWMYLEDYKTVLLEHIKEKARYESIKMIRNYR